MADKGTKPLVLLIDDVAMNHKIVKDVLTEIDYRVAGAFNRDQAFNIIEEELPDLILLDIIMPEINGHDICMELKAGENTRDIPVIFLTARTEDDDIIWGFQLGAVDYIKKPFNPQELLARVSTHVELKRGKDRQRRLIEELEKALKEVKQLSGLLPICAHCKNVRDDRGYWGRVEEYLTTHTGVELTHSLCPKCVKELYPEMADRILGEDNK